MHNSGGSNKSTRSNVLYKEVDAIKIGCKKLKLFVAYEGLSISCYHQSVTFIVFTFWYKFYQYTLKTYKISLDPDSCRIAKKYIAVEKNYLQML